MGNFMNKPGRSSLWIVVTAVADGTDTKIKIGQRFLGADHIGRALGYSAHHVRQSLKKALPVVDFMPQGPATLRGITFWYEKDLNIFNRVNATLALAKKSDGASLVSTSTGSIEQQSDGGGAQ